MAKSGRIGRTQTKISEIMRSVRSSATGPELAFQSAVRTLGLRPKMNVQSLPGKPDFVFPSQRLAVFIDGDFWHGNQWVRRKLPSLDEQFSTNSLRTRWTTKIRKNMQRDSFVTAKLKSEGWKVLRFWASDLMSNLDWCVSATARAIETQALIEEDIISRKTVAEFFAGIGLIRMGLEKQGWKVAFANDFDEDKLQMYRNHFSDADGHFVLGDIHALEPDTIPRVTLATASFPCNDLSLAGSRGGLHAKNSSAFWGFVNLLEQMGENKPPLVLIENVPGFITSHGGKDFRQALLALNGLGYVVDPFLLDAVSFVPQSRQRLFIVGILTTLPYSLASPPPNFDSENVLRPAMLSTFIKNNPDILWYLRTLPSPPIRSNSIETILDQLSPNDPLWWDKERKQYLFRQFSPKHKKIALEMIARRRWSYGTVFRRIRNEKSMAELRTDGIAGCLRTPRGGSARQILFKAGFGEYSVRLLNARECAKLMGADEYQIDSQLKLNQALFGFGDAVCVPAIEWIATYYLNPLVNELMRSRPI